MKNIKYELIPLLSGLLIFGGCKENTHSRPGQAARNSEHGSSSSLRPSKTAQDSSEDPLDAGASDDSDGDPEFNESRRQLTSRDKSFFKRASLKSLLRLVPLDAEHIDRITRAVRGRSTEPGEAGLAIQTAEAAYNRLITNISMAAPPRVYGEDADYFYFSGGTRGEPVNDFSTGLRVSKSGGDVRIWNAK